MSNLNSEVKVSDPAQNMKCFKCGLEIDRSGKWVQKEITIWDGDQGESNELNYHDKCFFGGK